MTAVCPICGAAVTDRARDCPTCHLDVGLFGPVREAGAMSRDSDPVYYRTIAELFRSADLLGPPPDLPEPAPVRVPPGLPSSLAGPAPAARPPAPSLPLLPVPRVPELPSGDALRSRSHEYLVLGEALGTPVPELRARADAAVESGEDGALREVVREMYVHLASALIAAYDDAAARRNELASRSGGAVADPELAAVRSAVEAGDLSGAYRHLGRVREELARKEETWATERILLTECDLLVETIRELGGDPTPALGPLQAGRRELEARQPEGAELLLAQTTYALWVLLEPRFTDELKRIRDRLVELRAAGSDVAPALASLRVVATEIRRRNFAGTIVAYRELRQAVGVAPAPGSIEVDGGTERAPGPA